ncbi:hypothetical protein ACFE04_016308 [Oxalis oulophora]
MQCREKITIELKKTCVFLHGAGRNLTIVEWSDHNRTRFSATFTSLAENIVVKGVTFKNVYNQLPNINKTSPIHQAVATLVGGDKTAFYECSFYGLQDTLWSDKGRHYFSECYIQGAIDFIFGKGQSFYERCRINVTAGEYYADSLKYGYVTAQRRDSDAEPGGFVFKNCQIFGDLKAYLGRPWGPYAIVLVFNTYIPDIIYPEGWSAGHFPDQKGPGADKSRRVSWSKKFTVDELHKFEHISYINSDAWLDNLPKLS